MTLRSHPDGYTVICDHCGRSVVVPLPQSLRLSPFLAINEVTLRQGWQGSADNPRIREKYGNGVFCPECMGGAS